MSKLLKQAALVSISTIALGASAGQTDGGFYVGAKGGYNNMKVQDGDFTVSSATVKGKKDRYLANIHVGYLYPLVQQFQVGLQLGGSAYGQAKATGTGSTTGSSKYKIYSAQLQVVGQVNVDQWFGSLRGGLGSFRTQYTEDATTFRMPRGNAYRGVMGLSIGYFSMITST